MKKIELLAPAKDMEGAFTAIKCGADAVYIGPSHFGARASASNSLNDIEQVVSFAHKYFARVYATVNTLLDDKEIIKAEKLIKDLYNIGIDGIIIQDMGLLELDLPPVPLIASTQCHNRTPEKVRFLQEAGFSRVILARELSLAEIREIRAKTDVELECFIHGSLCVSYSGQCYLSYAFGGRSGNRGDCAQPCRKKYSLTDSSGNILEKNKHLLCLKDLNLSKYLGHLIDAGITSFKIEGRLKDVDYIKNIVYFYRKNLDDILSEKKFHKTSSGNVKTNFIPDPHKTFNRGYTEYFLEGRKDDITSFDTPTWKGTPLGKVVQMGNYFFTVDGKEKLSNGDGICFFDEENKLLGTYINKVQGNRIYPAVMDFIKEGMTIYRNQDFVFLKNLRNSKIERKINLKLILCEEDDELVLTGIDEDGFKASSRIKFTGEIAKNRELAGKNIVKQLSSLGETEFFAENVEIKLGKLYFIPVKELNELRRRLITSLSEIRQNGYEIKTFRVEKNNYPYPEKVLSYTGNVINSYSRRFYERHGVTSIEPGVETGLRMKGRKVMTTKHCLRYEAGLCPKTGSSFDKSLYLIDEKEKRYTLKFNCKDCEMEIYF